MLTWPSVVPMIAKDVVLAAAPETQAQNLNFAYLLRLLMRYGMQMWRIFMA